MGRKKVLDFLTVVLFIGILLSFLLYVGMGTLIDAGTGRSPKGEVKSVADQFNLTFAEDQNIQSMIHFCDYRIFRHSNMQNLMIGKGNWIFRTCNPETGYDYLLDYVGGCPFSEKELSEIAARIAYTRNAYAEQGIEYILLIIPNSTTVYQKYLPGFLGKQSDRTRLAALTAYLSGTEETSFVNPAENMIHDSKTEFLYNNTEDSINAYGAFSLYNVLMTRLTAIPGNSTVRLKYEDIHFSVRMTEGKLVAKESGLETILENRTVSLTDDMADGYSVIRRNSRTIITQRNDSAVGASPVQIEFSKDWDRILMMPFFSNTFDTVIYQNHFSDDGVYEGETSPMAVIRILHESELQALLED